MAKSVADVLQTVCFARDVGKRGCPRDFLKCSLFTTHGATEVVARIKVCGRVAAGYVCGERVWLCEARTRGICVCGCVGVWVCGHSESVRSVRLVQRLFVEVVVVCAACDGR